MKLRLSGVQPASLRRGLVILTLPLLTVYAIVLGVLMGVVCILMLPSMMVDELFKSVPTAWNGRSE